MPLYPPTTLKLLSASSAPPYPPQMHSGRRTRPGAVGRGIRGGPDGAPPGHHSCGASACPRRPEVPLRRRPRDTRQGLPPSLTRPLPPVHHSPPRLGLRLGLPDTPAPPAKISSRVCMWRRRVVEGRDGARVRMAAIDHRRHEAILNELRTRLGDSREACPSLPSPRGSRGLAV
jgi:hypothetical protein